MECSKPKIAQWILSRITNPDERFSVVGDFEEMFRELVQRKGQSKAWCWYWKQVLKSIMIFIVNSLYWSSAMLKNFLTVTLRDFKEHKGYSTFSS